MSSFLLYILGICQSIGALPKLIKISLVFEKGLDPKNPLLADNGLGCADSITKCLLVSIKYS